jgi:hypothetical protein
MNHRPFEDWLLESQPLTSEQKLELRNHLKTCTSCTALTEVDMALRSPSLVIPSAGFTERFQSRMAAEHKQNRTRLFWGMGLLGLIVVLAASVALFELYSTWGKSPSEVLVTVISWLITMISSIRTYGSIGLVLLKVTARIIPLSLWLIMFGSGFLLIYFWATSLWKLAFASGARRLS